MAGPFDHLPPTMRALAEVQVEINAEQQDVASLRKRGWIVMRPNDAAVEKIAKVLNRRVHGDDLDHGTNELLLGDARAILAALSVKTVCNECGAVFPGNVDAARQAGWHIDYDADEARKNACPCVDVWIDDEDGA